MKKRVSVTGKCPAYPAKRRSRLLALEPRILFDGVALHDAAPMETDGEAHDVAALSAPRAADPPREILFIDSAVPDADILAGGARDGILVIRLDARLDPFEQITDTLNQHPGASTVHLVSHGGSGFLSLGGEAITETELNERADTIAEWRLALAENADLLVYGCDVSDSEAGQRFINRLAELSGADVAASSGPTGAAAQGGNWMLETAVGAIESSSFLTEAGAASYQARLATQALNGSAGWVPIMIGTNFDPVGDSQAKAADTDIVGDATHAAVFTAYDDNGTTDATADDTMAFRIRIDNPTSSTNFGGVAIIGMDADLNGSIDIFFAVDGRNNGQAIRILDPGTGANTSPNTTSTSPLPTGWIASNGIYSFSSSNYSVNAVAAGTDPHWSGDNDLGNDGKTDVFVSFKVSFQDIAAVLAKPSPTDRSGTVGPRGTAGIQNFTKNTIVQYVAMTQTQLGPINGDIGGVGPSYDKNATFSSLGTYSAQMSPSNPVSAADAANITDPLDANGLINASEDDAFVVRGTATANGWVRLVISDTDGGTGDITVWTQANATGAWTAPAQNLSGLAEGTLTFSASLVTGNGSNTLVTGSTGDTATATHDTVGPMIGIDALGTSGKPVISGTSTDVPAGSTITIKIDPNGDGILTDLITYTAVVGASGGWSINTATVTPTSGTMPATGLTAYAKVTAEAQDAAGNTGTATAITKPTVTPVTTNDTTPTITGTWGGTNGGTDTLAVTVNNVTYTTAGGALSISGMNWSLTIPNGNVLGTAGSPYEVTATVTRGGTSASDATSSELTLVSGPAVAITGGATATSTDSTPLIQGTTTLPQGSIITIRIDPNGDGNLADAVTYVATVGSGGAWSIDTGTASPISGSFPYGGIDGLARIRATATDTSGTSATADQDLTVTIPSVNISTITGANNGSGLLADNILNNAEDDSVTISGTSSNVAGQTVTVTVNDGTTTKSGTATVQSNGTWTVTFSGASTLSGLKDGSLTVTATVSTATDTTYVSHDATPPTIRVNSPATLSNNSQVIEGVSDLANGKSVLVSILTSSGTTIQHTVTVTDGKWVTPTLSLPSGSTQITVSSTDTDTAGNTAVGETVTRSVSSNNGFKQPTLAISTIAGDNVIVTSEIASGLTLSGTYNTESQSDKSGTITITITGKSLSTGNNTTLTKTYSFSNASSGNWSVSLTKSEVEAFANGTLNVTAAMTVSGNNASTYSLPLLALTNGVGQTVAVDAPIGDGNLSATEDGPGMTITGTATNATSQVISLTISDTDGTTANVTGTATVAANGTWSVSGLDLSSLANGTLTVTASLGSVSGSATVLHDKTPPLITITQGPGNSDATPLLQGTSDLAAGSTLTVSVDSDANGSTDVTYTTTVQSDGTWSVNTETATPASGSYPADGLSAASKVTVSGSDAAGNNTSLIATTITAINGDTGISSSDFITSDRTLVFTGKAEPNSSVAVSLNGSSIGTATADGTGAWTLDHTGTTLAAGSYTLTAVATKSSGVTATATQAFTIDTTAPAVAISAISTDSAGASTSDFITNDNTLAYSGTAEANSTVVVALTNSSNATVFTRTVTATGGNWSVDRNAYALSDGTYTLTAIATDSSGNSSTTASKTVVVDTTATIGLTTNYKTRDTTPLITGTTDIETGRTITVEIDPNNDGNFSDAQTYTTTVQAGGNWSLEATSALSGTVGIRVSGTDAAGNSASATRTMVVDTSAPAVTVTEPIGDGDLSASEDDAVVIQGSTSSVPSGSVLRVSITDGTTTITDTATVGADGTWQLSALNLSGMASGTLTVTATYVDDAGIPYADTATVLHSKAGTVTIDRITNDTGTVSDFTTSDQTLVFSGSANAGATVTLTLSGPSGGFTNQNVTANSSGAWTYDYTGTTLSNGTYSLQAVSGATVTQSIVIDNTAPSGPVTVATQTTDDTTPTITGTATLGAGESLFVAVNGVTYSTGDGNLSLSGSNWSLTIPTSNALTPASTSGGFNGKYHVVATIRDTAGNTLVDSTTYELTIQDTTAPAIDLDPSAAGSGNGSGIHHSLTSVGGAIVSLDDNTDAATVTEASDKIASLAITVGGLQDGANERLVFGSTTIAANGSSGTQTDITVGGVRVNITYAGGTFTIQKYNYASLTASEAQAILRDVQYRNTAATVTTGNRTFGFTATDDAANTATTATATVNVTSAADTTAPAAPSLDLTAGSDTGTSSTDDKTSDTTPTVRVTLNGSGVTAPVAGDVVKLIENGVEVGTATLTAGDITNDYVDITASTLAAGSKSFTATVTDAAGNASAASSALAVTIDTTAPAFASASVSGTTLTLTYTEAGVGMAGTTPAASDFAVSKNGSTAVAVNSVAVDATARTVTLTLASAITNADSNIVVSYTAGTNRIADIAGNEAANLTSQAVTNASGDTTAPAAPSVDLNDASDTGTSSTDDKTSDTTPTIRITLNGSGVTAPVAGDVVKLLENGVEVGTATLTAADITNDYVDITASTLAAGSKSFTATVTDAAGNASSASSALAVTIDTTAPAFASASVSGTTLTLTYTEAGVGMAGTTPAASDFAVSKNGSTTVAVNSVAVDATARTVTLTLGSAITNADSNIVVSYTAGTNRIADIAGNEAANLTSQAVTNASGDTTAPAAPSVDLTDASDTGTSSTDDKTSDTTPTVRVTLNGSGVTAPVAGDVVKLIENGTVVGTATLTAGDITNDYVDITASTLAAGSKSFTATVTDAAGNASSASSALAVTIDITAPAFASASVSGTTLTLTYTEAGVGMAGTTPGASDFAVSKNGGTAVAVNSVAVDATAKTVTLTLGSAITNADSNIVVSYTAGTNRIADIAGNEAANLTNQAVTNASGDTTAPAAPSIDLTDASDTGTSSTDDKTSDTTPTVRVTLNGSGVTAPVAGDVVKLLENGVEVGTATLTAADITNDYVDITASTLAAGSKSFTATVTDAAGNASSASSALAVTIDTTAPAFASASVSGTTLALTYTEAGVGMAGTTPAASDFAVSKNGGTAVAVNSVAVDATARTVTLTLASAITNADSNIVVSYTAGTNRIADIAGNEAANLSSQAVTNASGDTTAPEAPSVDLNDASDTGTSSTDDKTSDTTPTVRITLNGSGVTAPVAGDVVKLLENGVEVGTATLTAADITSDYVDITASTLSAGSKSFTATVTDAAGNVSAASSALSVTIDTTAPVFASASVSGTTLTLTYTEAGVGMAGTTPAASDFAVSKNGGTAVAVNSVAVDATAKTVTLTLGSAITNADSNIAVSYTAGTNRIADIAGNEAANLSNQAVTNASGDTTAPAAPSVDLTDASDTGTSSTDDKTSDTTPTVRVTLNGSGVTAPVAGDVVKLLENGVEVGTATLTAADITNDYVDITASTLAAGSKSFTATITDAASNTSAASSALAVTIDTTAPVFASASVSGTTLTLTYTEDGVGMADTVPGTGAFTVSKNGGTPVAVSSVAVNTGAKTVTLTLGSAITNADSNIVVSYTADTSKIRDIAGNEAANLTNQTVTNSSGDTTAPAAPSIDLTDASDTGTLNNDDKTSDTTPTVRVTLNGTGVTAPVAGDVVKLIENGTVVGTATLTAADITNDYVDITASTLAAGSKSFTATITDAASNTSAASSALAVTIDTTAPLFASASVSGTTLTLTYTEDGVGMADTVPGTGAFTVSKNGGTPVAVSSVAVNAGTKTVTLTLGSAITNADSNIVVSYTADTSKIRDIAGNEAANLSNQAVTNASGDTTAPAAPSVDLTDASDTGTSSTDDKTSDTTPTVRVTLNGSGVTAPVAGDVVKLIENGTVVGTATLTAADITNDYVDITASTLSAGSKSFTATVTDAAGNASAASSALAVTIDTTAPVFASASVSGTTLTLTYTEAGVGMAGTTPGASDFAVSKNSSTAVAVNSVAVDATARTVTLTLGSAITNADSNIVVSYTAGTNRIADIAGNEAANLSNQAVTNASGDTTAPAAPALSLLASSDSGTSNSDAYTNDTTPTIRVSLNGTGAAAPVAGDVVKLYLDATQVGIASLSASDITNGYVDITTSALGADGAKSLTATVTDGANNVSASSATLDLTLDTVVAAPVVSLANDSGSSGSDRITNNGALSVSGIESGASVQYSADGATWSATFTPAQGDNTVFVRQTDRAGNTSSTSSLSFTLDSTIATPGISLQTDSGSSNSDRITNNGVVSVSGIEPGAAVEYSTDGNSWSGSVTATEGSNTIRVRQTDSAGNVSGTASVSFTLDTRVEAPALTLQVDSGASASDRVTNNGALTLSGVETGATVSYSTDGSNWSSSYSLVEGNNTVHVKQTDIAGNTSASSSVSLTLDRIVATPTVTLQKDTGTSNSDRITSDPTLAVGGIEANATVEYSSNGTTWSSGFTAAEGANTVHVRQTDRAGNVSGVASLSFVYEPVPPAPVVQLASDTGSSNSDRITNNGALAVSGIKNGATVQYSTDGVNWTSGFTAAEGANTVYVRQIAVSGTTSEAAILSFTLDTRVAPPTVALITDSGTSASDAITNRSDLSVGGVESGAIVQYSADGANWSGSVQPAEGTNTVFVRQIDLAGNISGASSLTYRLDTQVAAPGISGASPNSSGVVSDASVTVTGIESGANVEYSTDGASWGSGYTAVEGANTVYVRQTDLAGNTSPASSISFTLNTLAALPGTTTPGSTTPSDPGTVATSPTPGTGTPTGDTGTATSPPASEAASTTGSAPSSVTPIVSGSQSAAPATSGLVAVNTGEQTSTQPTGRINLLAGIPLPPEASRSSSAGPEASVLASTDRGFPVSRVQATGTASNDPNDAGSRSASRNAAIDQAQQKGNDRLFVYQGIRDTAVQASVGIDYFVPREAFGHTNVNAVVQLDATLVDGSPLPEWLDFDPVSGRFSGRPPAGETTQLDIKVIARDNDGREASSTFKVRVEPGDSRQTRDANEAKPPAQRNAGSKDGAPQKTSDAAPRKATPFDEQLRTAKPARDPLLARIAAADGKAIKNARIQRTS